MQVKGRGGCASRRSWAGLLSSIVLAGLAIAPSSATAVVVYGWHAVGIGQVNKLTHAEDFAPEAIFGNLVCLSAKNCWTAGTGLTQSAGNIPLSEHWNGKRFKLVQTRVAKARLQGMACVSPGDCWAAGGVGTNPPLNSFGLLAHYRPLMEQWNGKKWAERKVPNPKGGKDDELADVSCRGAKNCFAVGWIASSGGHGRPLIEHWNGKKWKITAQHALKHQLYAALDGIDCPSKSTCIAVGLEQASKTSSPHAFAEVRHGKKWSSKSMPGPVHESNTQLYGLSCPTTTYCMATGTAFFFPSGGQDPGTPIVEIWHGSRWSLKRPSLPGPAIGGEVNDLDGVACSASTDCWAVGTTATDQASNPAVTARWDGHGFTKIDSDDPYPSDHLDAVGCAKESFCLAVGYGTTKTGRLRLYALKLRVVSCPRCKAGDPADVRSRAG